MSNANPDRAQSKKSVGGQLIIPAFALLFTLYYFYTIIDSPWTAQVSAFFIGSVLIVLVLIFAARALRSVRRAQADWGVGDLIAPRSILPRRLGLLALTVGYIVLLEWGGFTLTTFVYLACAMVLLGGTRVTRPAIILAAAFSIGGYLLFVAAFKTRFPAGPFEQMMGVLF
ncbi:MAG: tripartite tricarboxylate transporter TctB family protein [Gammaproteobacteria bacterium]|nr:tripartite tricarboxylate transporter TctB family protein [Gammaproteobacteria bacterium]